MCICNLWFFISHFSIDWNSKILINRQCMYDDYIGSFSPTNSKVTLLTSFSFINRNKNCWLFIKLKILQNFRVYIFLLVEKVKTETVHETKILSEKWKMRRLPILDCIPSITPNHWSNQNQLESPSEDWWSLGHQRGNRSPGMGCV